MSSISPAGVQMALADFIDQRVMPAISSDNSAYRWLIGGASTLFLSRFGSMYEQYKPVLVSFGLLDDSGNIKVEDATKFIYSAFEKQREVKMPLLGLPFTFDKTDGDVFIQILKSKGV